MGDRRPALRRREDPAGAGRGEREVRLRPAAADERVAGFEDGGAVDAHSLPVGVLVPGLRLLGEGKPGGVTSAWPLRLRVCRYRVELWRSCVTSAERRMRDFSGG